MAWVLDLLEHRYGVRSLLVEGGGALIAQLLEVDLLNELNLTLCPLLIGGRGGPSLVDGAGFDAHTMRRLQLCQHQVVGDEIYLRYRVLPTGQRSSAKG